MQYVFISYAHDGPGTTYVHRLAESLNLVGLRTWFDYQIVAGQRWRHVVRDHIDACAAFIVVMTPEAEESPWVDREVTRAEAGHKPILPVLLEGKTFFRLTDLQYEDVTGGQLPGTQFYHRLKVLLAPPPRGTGHDKNSAP